MRRHYLEERLDFLDVWLQGLRVTGHWVDAASRCQREHREKLGNEHAPVLVKVVMLDSIPYPILDLPIILKL